MKNTHRSLCLRAMALFDMLKHGPQDELVNQWLEDLMSADRDEYVKNPADAYDGSFPVRIESKTT